MQNLFPLSSVQLAPLLVGWVEPDLVEAGLREPPHVLAAARDAGVEVGVVIRSELIFQHTKVATGLLHRFLWFAARNRGAQRVHPVGLLDDVLVVRWRRRR